jgi:hypothetical protein
VLNYEKSFQSWQNFWDEKSFHETQFCVTELIVIVTWLINALPGSSSVNTNASSNRRETIFYVVRAKEKH